MHTIIESVINKFKKHPQLWYTIALAVVIAVAFFFTVSRFVIIAQDAEERLHQVRVGTLHDVFVSLLPDGKLDTLFLSLRMKYIADLNPSITAFDVVRQDNSNRYSIIASHDVSRVGKAYEDISFSFSLAAGKPDESFTTQHVHNNERFFRTVRAIRNQDGPLTFVVADQSLSEADVVIEREIRQSLYLFFIILTLVMILFLRNSRIVDYVSLYKKLKEVDSLKDDFISMASHELRTPLTAIRGYSELLLESKTASSTDKEYASRIDASAHRLDMLVSDMLDVARIEQGRMSFTMSEVDIEEVLNRVVEGLLPVAQKKKLQLSFSIKEKGVVCLDARRLEQVLHNVIGNSIKYTRTGSVLISLYIDNDMQVIHVSDTGIGMNSVALEHLFEKFYRVKNKFTTDVVGTGLGLWITKQIVEHMHGKIRVESIEGVGTHTKIFFPITRKLV